MTVGKKSVVKYKERQAEENERERGMGVSCNKEEGEKRVMVKDRKQEVRKREGQSEKRGRDCEKKTE